MRRRLFPVATALLLSLVLVACGDDAEEVTDDADGADDAVEESTDDGDVGDVDDAEEDDGATEEADDGGEGQDEAAGDDPGASVVLDGQELTVLPGTQQCIVLPGADGDEDPVRILLEVADPDAGDGDPRGRMSLSMDRDEEGSVVRLGSGLDVIDEINFEWRAEGPEVEAARIDADGAEVEDLTLELRDLDYDEDEPGEDVVLSATVACG